MAHSGRARVNAISTALPDSQLRLGGREGGRGGGGEERMRERDVEAQEREDETVRLVGRT